MDEQELLEQYFWDGFRYSSIARFLHEYHGIDISARTVRRRLHDYGLSRRNSPASLVTVWNAVNAELRGPGQLGGYRSMAATLRRKYHLQVPVHTVRQILRQIDPVGVAARRQHRLLRRTYWSRGPNHLWHVDGYDKLTPYGFSISGCIDGFSRRIIWLKCASSNHDPGVIASYYLDAVTSAGGCPHAVRTDCGTENTTMAAVQTYLRQDRSAHVYGTSPSNQRIEAWWSFFRRNRTQWWIDTFASLADDGSFHYGNWKELDCLRFAFMPLVRKDLQEVARQWNVHRIRPDARARCPAGVPDELYYLPQPPAVDCLHRNTAPLSAAIADMVSEPSVVAHNDFGEYLRYLCDHNGWQAPTTVGEATVLYRHLQRIV